MTAPTMAHFGTIPALDIADRMKLAEGRPLPRRMMAAMAQQDCGQCGSSCEEYSLSIFRKKEGRLNLCVPGGKDTARMLKKLARRSAPGRRRPRRRPHLRPPRLPKSRTSRPGRRRGARATIP